MGESMNISHFLDVLGKMSAERKKAIAAAISQPAARPEAQEYPDVSSGSRAEPSR